MVGLKQLAMRVSLFPSFFWLEGDEAPLGPETLLSGRGVPLG